MNSVILDHTALSALGRGNHLLARMIDAAHSEVDRRIFAPALCLTAAVAERPDLADHIGALPAIDIIELGYASASAVGKLVAAGVEWQTAHAVEAARPAVDWPAGRPVVTDSPSIYTGHRIAVISLN